MSKTKSSARKAAKTVDLFYEPTQYSDDDWGNIELPGLTDEELHSKNWERATIAKQMAEKRDPKEWHEKNTARFKNPKWRAKNKKKIQEWWNDPEYKQRVIESRANSEAYQQGVKNAIKKRMANDEWRKNIAESRRRQAKDPSWREKMINGYHKYLDSEKGKNARVENGKKNASNPEFARRVMLGRGILPFFTPWGLYYNANLASSESREKHDEYFAPGRIRKLLKEKHKDFVYTTWQEYDKYYGIKGLPQSI